MVPHGSISLVYNQKVMKKSSQKLYIVFLGLYLLTCATNAIAQESNVKILDLIVLPFLETTTVGSIKEETNLIKYQISFKINTLNEASKVFICLGSDSSKCDVENLLGEIINEGGIFYSKMGNDFKPIYNMMEVVFIIELTKSQLESWKTTSVFVTDNNDLISNKIYF